MAYSLLQSVKAHSAAAYVNGMTVTMPSPTIAGSLIVVCIMTSAGTANDVTGVTDDAASTYIKAGSYMTNNRVVDIWYAYNVGAITSNKVYIAMASYVQTHVHVRAYGGMLTTAAVFDKAENEGDSTYVNVHSATLIPSGAGNLLVGAYVGTNGLATFTTVGTSENLLQDAFDFVSAASFTAPSTGAVSQTQSINDSEYEWGAMAVASFVPSTTPGSVVKRYNGTAWVNVTVVVVH